MDNQQSEKFAALWASAQPTITAFIRTLVPDFQQADEVLQRVAVMLVRKFGEFDGKRSFSAWAVGFAKFEVLYYRRQRATDKHRFLDDAVVEQVAAAYERIVDDVDPVREALSKCVAELEGRAKQVIELRYAKGMNSRGIAEKLDLSSGAVRMLLSRVRNALRQCIERRVRLLDLPTVK